MGGGGGRGAGGTSAIHMCMLGSSTDASAGRCSNDTPTCAQHDWHDWHDMREGGGGGRGPGGGEEEEDGANAPSSSPRYKVTAPKMPGLGEHWSGKAATGPAPTQDARMVRKEASYASDRSVLTGERYQGSPLCSHSCPRGEHTQQMGVGRGRGRGRGGGRGRGRGMSWRLNVHLHIHPTPMQWATSQSRLSPFFPVATQPPAAPWRSDGSAFPAPGARGWPGARTHTPGRPSDSCHQCPRRPPAAGWPRTTSAQCGCTAAGHCAPAPKAKRGRRGKARVRVGGGGGGSATVDCRAGCRPRLFC